VKRERKTHEMCSQKDWDPTAFERRGGEIKKDEASYGKGNSKETSGRKKGEGRAPF